MYIKAENVSKLSNEALKEANKELALKAWNELKAGDKDNSRNYGLLATICYMSYTNRENREIKRKEAAARV